MRNKLSSTSQKSQKQYNISMIMIFCTEISNLKILLLMSMVISNLLISVSLRSILRGKIGLTHFVVVQSIWPPRCSLLRGTELWEISLDGITNGQIFIIQVLCCMKCQQVYLLFSLKIEKKCTRIFYSVLSPFLLICHQNAEVF